MLNLVEISPVVLQNCIFAISLLSPIGKRRIPSIQQTFIHFIQGLFVQSLVKIDLGVYRIRFLKFSGSGVEDFLKLSMYFKNFVCISP